MSVIEAAIGVDVGTGSARAGVFALDDGTRLGQASHKIVTWRPRTDHVQQSSADIWAAVVASVRVALAAAGDLRVRGIGFDATCSLVVADATGAPLPVDADPAEGDDGPVQDVIVWMDHRALAEAEAINATCHPVLRYVGGRISPEMQTPKLLWLARHRPGIFARARHFFDLPDFLTWRATGAVSRSLCSTVCKWTYLGHEQRWDAGFFRAIGLGALADEGFARIGTRILPPGAPVGTGLTAAAAAELGLPPGTPVGASAIDAHAGGIGLIGAAGAGADAPDAAALARRLALIAGTSSCHMAVSPEPRFVAGVWGPYFGAMLPGLWLNEGGQSATGALIDHVITGHPAYPELAEAARAGGGSVYAALNTRLVRLARDLPFPAALTAELHVLPDFHGNRSPRADPSLRGMISGLTLAADADALALLYLATLQALAYGTRHIVEALAAAGSAIDLVLATGGGARNTNFLRAHADTLGCPIALPRESETVLLGAAILGAVADGAYADIPAAMARMSGIDRVVAPAGGDVARYHDAKYAVFRRLHADQLAYRALMAEPGLRLPARG
ncbi:MAG: FGGY-family carbohydrate kinase [Rhodospirillales bacterium]|nr:FGGY-family carbohydrate kinase [Rhodospirillales bacterium]